MRWVAAVGIVLGLLPASAIAEAPEATGPYAVRVERVRIPLPVDPNGPEGALPGVDADIYVPRGAGPRPLIELGHAWPGTLAEFPLSGWGQRLASRGYVVIVADRRAGTSGAGLGRLTDVFDLDSDVGAEDMLRILRWAIAESSKPGTVLTGAVDGRRLALGGHSLGGYMATFAAVRAQTEGPRLDALVLLDPTDERLGTYTLDSSLVQAPKVRIPTIVLASEADIHPIQCDMDDGNDCTIVSHQEFAALRTIKLGIKVLGSDHEDVEDPNTTGNSLVFLQMYQRYAMAWLEYWLDGDCDAAEWLVELPDRENGRISRLPGGSLPVASGPCSPQATKRPTSRSRTKTTKRSRCRSSRARRSSSTSTPRRTRRGARRRRAACATTVPTTSGPASPSSASRRTPSSTSRSSTTRRA
jgi:dienelactone hydrolase